LINKGNKDFLYDPESFGVRVGEEVYQQSVSDASGLVPAGKVQTAFFVVAGTASGGRNDLAVTNKFAVLMRQVTGEMDLHRKMSTEWQEPPNAIPGTPWQEPALPEGDSKVVRDQPKSKGGKHPRKAISEKPKAMPTLTEDHSDSPHKGDPKGKEVAQHNE